MKKFVAGLLVLCLLATAALAQEIAFTDGTLSVEGRTESGETVSLELKDFYLLGTAENGDALIYNKGTAYYVSADEMADVTSRADALPEIAKIPAVAKGDSSDDAAAFQSELIAAGYLTGQKAFISARAFSAVRCAGFVLCWATPKQWSPSTAACCGMSAERWKSCSSRTRACAY